MNTIDFSGLTPIEDTAGDGPEDTLLLRNMADNARTFLLSFSWCKGIENGWFGIGIGGVVAVFLFKIDSPEKSIDKMLWVVIGDLPPAYLVTDESPTPEDALRVYTGLMEEWITAAREGRSIEECIPVNAPPTLSNADALEKRLNFVKSELLSKM